MDFNLQFTRRRVVILIIVAIAAAFAGHSCRAQDEGELVKMITTSGRVEPGEYSISRPLIFGGPDAINPAVYGPVHAHGAKITIADGGGYHALIFLGGAPEWHGGEIDGNRAGQDYVDRDGTIAGDGVFDPEFGNTGLVAFKGCTRPALIGTTLRNFVSDGVVFGGPREFATVDRCSFYDQASPVGFYPQAVKHRHAGFDTELLVSNSNFHRCNIAVCAQETPARRFTVGKLSIVNVGAFESRQSAFYNEGNSAMSIVNSRAVNTFPTFQHFVKGHGGELFIDNSLLLGGTITGGEFKARQRRARIHRSTVGRQLQGTDKVLLSGFTEADDCRFVGVPFFYAASVRNLDGRNTFNGMPIVDQRFGRGGSDSRRNWQEQLEALN